MRARISGGILGWLIGVVPLIAVNILDYQGLFAFQDAALAGLVALGGGIVLGGIVAGLLGGRTGGVPAAATSGTLAASLYAVTLISLIIGTGILDTASPLIALHPMRISMAIIFLAAILLAITIVTSAIFGRHASTASSTSPAHYSAHTSRPPYDAHSMRTPNHSQSHQRNAEYDEYNEYNDGYRAHPDARYSSTYGAGASRPLSPDASDPRYATSRSRSANASGGRRDERPPFRDAGWRQSER